MARRGRLVELDDSLQADLLVATHERLAELGYEPYEVSNFARSPEHRSRHNLKYWIGAPYLGLGPSAHSFRPPVRSWNVADRREYVRRIGSGEPVEEGSERLTGEQELLESLMLGLRTTTGVDLGSLETRFGVSLMGQNAVRVEGWLEAGWVRIDGSRLLPTPRGLAVADRLAASFELPAGATRT
jgi:oxygen-independent coproporphyrinogen-3 oxidase